MKDTVFQYIKMISPMKKFNRNDTNRSSERSRDDSPRFSRDSPRFGGRDRYEDRDSVEKKKYPATCAKCAGRCEVPFRPREGKPVYCSNCFNKNDTYESSRQDNKPFPDSKSELGQINQKLDLIMKALHIK